MRLPIAFRAGESTIHCDLHGISLLLANRVSQMARGTARAAAMDGLGTLDNELGRCAGRPRVLERTRLSLRRGISAPRGRRSHEKRAASRRKTDGCFQYQRRIFDHESRGVISEAEFNGVGWFRGLLLVLRVTQPPLQRSPVRSARKILADHHCLESIQTVTACRMPTHF